ncbi:hypothetical protein [Actinoplanes sp. NPDC049265]|uniref:hypothetical protein n=1 Tax=Actinoplanes sp. NPDC049265 TaxID=3363902 RepID=UPI00371673D2
MLEPGRTVPNIKVLNTYDDIVKLAHPEMQTAVRDYVADSGTVVELHTAAEMQAHFMAFFERYDVLSIDVTQSHADDWFFFHELRWTVRDRNRDTVVVHQRAEFAEVSADGRIVAYVGHGVDPVLQHHGGLK